jgi:hypothetical protein
VAFLAAVLTLSLVIAVTLIEDHVLTIVVSALTLRRGR